jgi:protein PET100
MGGPNLEIFKFSLYLFVPIFALVHFGDPHWYRNTVLPVNMIKCLTLASINSRLSIKTSYFLQRKGYFRQVWCFRVELIHLIILQDLPTDQKSLREELARIKNERLARRAAKEKEEKKS